MMLGLGSMADGIKCKEGDQLGARSLRSLRRSVRLLKVKQARAKEQSEILRLKRDLKALTKRTAAAEEPLPSAGKKRKKKVIITTTPVKKEAVEFMIAKPHKPLDGLPEGKLATFSQELREFFARRKAIADKVLEYEQALIRQFEKRGYAEDYAEIEVTDNEDN